MDVCAFEWHLPSVIAFFCVLQDQHFGWQSVCCIFDPLQICYQPLIGVCFQSSPVIQDETMLPNVSNLDDLETKFQIHYELPRRLLWVKCKIKPCSFILKPLLWYFCSLCSVIKFRRYWKLKGICKLHWHSQYCNFPQSKVCPTPLYVHTVNVCIHIFISGSSCHFFGLA